MLTAIILMSFIAAAFWRQAIKLTIAAIVVVLLLGVIQLAQIVDRAADATVDRTTVSGKR